MVKSDNKKVVDTINKYNRQLCEFCGHSMVFLPKVEFLICKHCGRKVINKTRGHFIRKIYGELDVYNRKG